MLLLFWQVKMKNPLRRYFDWEDRLWFRRNLKWWERKRAKGKAHFVSMVALLWSIIMIAGTSLADYFIHKDFNIAKFVIGIPLNFLFGYFFGLFLWYLNEKRYQKFVNSNAKVNSHRY
jgi:ACR3 family arsenite efflux pump ArsB